MYIYVHIYVHMTLALSGSPFVYINITIAPRGFIQQNLRATNATETPTADYIKHTHTTNTQVPYTERIRSRPTKIVSFSSCCMQRTGSPLASGWSEYQLV